LELSKRYSIKHFIYASSSSVYGGNESLPFKEVHKVDHPISIYAATKRSNELISHTYSHLYNLPITGLRFFTVYGPWGRPDMALFKFTDSILKGRPIEVFNNGDMMRDFTYIDDVIESIKKIIDKPAESDKNFDKNNTDPSSSWCPYKIFNIGNSQPTPLMNYIEEIENSLKIKAKINFLPMQMGDVKSTFADTALLEEWIKYKPKTSIKEGVRNFVKWYLEFYKINKVR
jgi:UDP-glucuronate 4-epimerase